jgi:hypothetical protein
MKVEVTDVHRGEPVRRTITEGLFREDWLFQKCMKVYQSRSTFCVLKVFRFSLTNTGAATKISRHRQREMFAFNLWTKEKLLKIHFGTAIPTISPVLLTQIGYYPIDGQVNAVCVTRTVHTCVCYCTVSAKNVKLSRPTYYYYYYYYW